MSRKNFADILRIGLFKEVLNTDCEECSKCIFEDDPATCKLYYAMDLLYKKTRQRVAKQIFEEIDGITDLFAKGLIGELEMYDKLAELKNKYTEEKQ
jgi:hypothetical protein